MPDDVEGDSGIDKNKNNPDPYNEVNLDKGNDDPDLNQSPGYVYEEQETNLVLMKRMKIMVRMLMVVIILVLMTTIKIVIIMLLTTQVT